MNNLISVVLVFMAAVAVYLRQHSLLARTQADNQQIAGAIVALDARVKNLEARRSDVESRLARARSEVRTEQERELARRPVPPDPNRNGGWPAGEPYFYLPKRDLPRLRYTAFKSGGDYMMSLYVQPRGSVGKASPGPVAVFTPRFPQSLGRTDPVSDDTAILFGLTGDEREALDAAYRELWEQFRERGLARVERVAPETGWAFPAVTEYHIPFLTDEANQVLAGLRGTLREVLGSPRGDYFVDGIAGKSITNSLLYQAQTEYFIAFGSKRSPGGEAQSEVSYSHSHAASSFWGGEPLSRNSFLSWFFTDHMPNPNP